MRLYKRTSAKGPAPVTSVPLDGGPREVDPALHKALTDMHLYVLVIDAERERIAQQIAGLEASTDDPRIVADFERRHLAITQELETLRAMVAALSGTSVPGALRADRSVSHNRPPRTARTAA